MQEVINIVCDYNLIIIMLSLKKLKVITSEWYRNSWLNRAMTLCQTTALKRHLGLFFFSYVGDEYKAALALQIAFPYVLRLSCPGEILLNWLNAI